QQIKGIQDRQPGFDQRQKLLVEDQELARLDGAAGGKADFPGRKQSPRLYPINQKPLLHEALPHLSRGVAVLHLLREASTLIRDFYQEFSHGSDLRCPEMPRKSLALAF